MGEEKHSAIWDLVAQERGHGSDPETAGANTQMSLASTERAGQPGWKTGDGGSGGLKSDKALWSGASEGVGSLRGNLTKGAAKLDEGQKGLGASDITVTGFVSGSAQLGIYETWDRYLDLVARECGELSGKLEKAGNDHYQNDEAIKQAFDEQRTKPEEPTSHGGHPSTGGHPSQGR